MRTGLLLIIILLAVNMAKADPDPKIFLDSISDSDNPKKDTEVIEWFISPQTLDKQPVFDPAAADPPLSLKAAIGIAHASLGGNVPNLDKWRLESVELDQIDRGKSGETIPESWSDEPSGRWYYKIVFSGSVPRPDLNLTDFDTTQSFFVLMDGTLSEKRTRPQTKEEIDSDKQMGDQIRQSIKDGK